jgi:hypothetical protein
VGNLFGSPEVEQAEALKCPQLILPAGNDPDNLKAGGDVQRVLLSKPFGEDCEIHEFPDMKHGWVVRGDLNDPLCARDVKLALDMATEYLKKHSK